jgi:hypothetical protein
MGGTACGTPILAGETVMSWIARFARDEAGLEPFDFLRIIGLSATEVLEAAPVTLDRLAAVTGVPQARIGQGAFRGVEDRHYEHRGLRFHSLFAPRMRTTFCPACLLADARPDRPGRGRRVGRASWLFSPVRTCPVHDVALFRSAATSLAERFQDMDAVAPADADLEALVAAAPRREISPLQVWFETRLDGGAGPAWLDGQNVEQASKTCEMVGAALLFGVDASVRALSEDQLDAAGAAGFPFAAGGEEGVREALSELCRRFRDGGAKGGRQAALGLIYHWLQFHRSGQAKGPVEEVVREFILGTMAVDPGTVLFGRTVPTRRRHSVASLAKRTRLHPKTLNRALVTGGVLPEGDPDRVDGFLSFDAAAGEALAGRVLGSVPVVHVPALMGCTRRQAELLARSGLLGGSATAPGTMLHMPAAVDLDSFMDSFLGSAIPVPRRGAGMTDVIAAAKATRWPVYDIVRLVLDGGLERVERCHARREFGAVLVDPEEVRRVLDARLARGRLTIAEAASRLRLRPGGVRALMSTPDRDGRSFLTAFTETIGKAAPRYFFDESDLDRYAANHVDLEEISRERGVVPKILRGRLSAAGIEPILPRSKLDRHVYRRADL